MSLCSGPVGPVPVGPVPVGPVPVGPVPVGPVLVGPVVISFLVVIRALITTTLILSHKTVMFLVCFKGVLLFLYEKYTLLSVFHQKYKFSNKNDIVSALRHLQNIFSIPLFTHHF